MDKLQIIVKNKETYQHLMWFLKKFNQEELEILETRGSFEYIQEELRHELREINSGNSTLINIDELDEELEKIISANEDSNI